MQAQEPSGTIEVAERLRISREALKLTQARLCEITGISTSTWNNAETADARIGLESALKLCQATGLTLDWVYRGIRRGLDPELRDAIGKKLAETTSSRTQSRSA